MFPTCMSPLSPVRSLPKQNYGLCRDVFNFHGEIVDQEEYKKGKIDMKVFLLASVGLRVNASHDPGEIACYYLQICYL